MPEAAEAVVVEASSRCYRCNAPLNPAAPGVCPECGRSQTRVCFCGTTISRALTVCPECGTDWSRIRRSRRKSKEERRAETSRAALMGGVLALIVGGLGYGLWRLSVSGQVAAGADAAGDSLSSLGTTVLRALEVAWAPLVVFVVGAAGGLAIHYVRQQQRRRKRRRVTKKRSSSAE